MNEETFLSALRDDPSDEVTWLALADWLDEDGQPDRAELLRLTRQLRALPPDERAEVRRRVVELLEAGVRPVVVERTNSIGMRLALVPAGAFLMGSPTDEPERDWDERLHPVTITGPFWLGVFQVTQGQWKTVMGGNPSKHSDGGAARNEVAGQTTDDFPVECVSWLDAQEFLKRLEAAHALGPWEYRLPTEAQWEYACRAAGVATEPFCFRAPSRVLTSSLANFDSNVPYGGGKPNQPLPWRPRGVGNYDPNPLGVHDLHGNVWEWCQDWYGPYEAGPLSDPSGPAEGTERVCRGGSWISDGEDCRCASRIKHRPTERNARLGFRVAAVPRLRRGEKAT